MSSSSQPHDETTKRAGRKEAAKVVTAGYAPTGHELASFMRQESMPAFTLGTVDSMLCDEQVRLSCGVAVAPMVEIEVDIEGGKEAAFAKSEIERIWNSHAVKLFSGFWYGRFGGEVVYHSHQGQFRTKNILPVHPGDFKILQSKKTKAIIGIRVEERFHSSVMDGQAGKVDLLGPKALIFLNGSEERFRSLRGYSDLEPAHRPWWEKTSRDGAQDIRLNWHHSCAFDKGDIFYPPGDQKDENGNPIPARDWAMRMLEMARSGVAWAFPNIYDDNGNRLWDRTRPSINGDGAQFSAYIGELDVAIARGVGIPDDIIAQNSGTGSYAGRSIPMRAFLQTRFAKARALVNCISDSIVRYLCQVNYGSANYSIVGIRLKMADEMLNEGKDQPQQLPGMEQSEDGIPDESAVPEEFAEDFDELENGEVPFSDPDEWSPYRGPRGGTGWVNATTGKILFQKERPGRESADQGQHISNRKQAGSESAEHKAKRLQREKAHKKLNGKASVDQERSDRAKAAFKRAGKKELTFAAAREALVLSSIKNAVHIGGTDVFDGFITKTGQWRGPEDNDKIAHAIEVKTLIDNKNNKITMHPEAKRRKEYFARKTQCAVHLIGVEGRTKYKDGENMAQLEIAMKKAGITKPPYAWYKRGLGSPYLWTCMPVNSPEELTAVMSMSIKELAKKSMTDVRYLNAMPMWQGGAKPYASITSEKSADSNGRKVTVRKVK